MLAVFSMTAASSALRDSHRSFHLPTLSSSAAALVCSPSNAASHSWVTFIISSSLAPVTSVPTPASCETGPLYVPASIICGASMGTMAMRGPTPGDVAVSLGIPNKCGSSLDKSGPQRVVVVTGAVLIPRSRTVARPFTSVPTSVRVMANRATGASVTLGSASKGATRMTGATTLGTMWCTRGAAGMARIAAVAALVTSSVGVSPSHSGSARASSAALIAAVSTLSVLATRATFSSPKTAARSAMTLTDPPSASTCAPTRLTSAAASTSTDLPPNEPLCVAASAMDGLGSSGLVLFQSSTPRKPRSRSLSESRSSMSSALSLPSDAALWVSSRNTDRWDASVSSLVSRSLPRSRSTRLASADSALAFVVALLDSLSAFASCATAAVAVPDAGFLAACGSGEPVSAAAADETAVLTSFCRSRRSAASFSDFFSALARVCVCADDSATARLSSVTSACSASISSGEGACAPCASSVALKRSLSASARDFSARSLAHSASSAARDSSSPWGVDGAEDGAGSDPGLAASFFLSSAILASRLFTISLSSVSARDAILSLRWASASASLASTSRLPSAPLDDAGSDDGVLGFLLPPFLAADVPPGVVPEEGVFTPSPKPPLSADANARLSCWSALSLDWTSSRRSAASAVARLARSSWRARSSRSARISSSASANEPV